MVIQPLSILRDTLKAHPEIFSDGAAGEVVRGSLKHESVQP